MAELKARVGNKGGHHEDPDVVQARFRADLDCMINKAEGEDEVHKSPEDNSLVRLWTKGKVYRYKAWFPLWAQTNMDILLRFGVAPVLLLRVQLGAAWMFLACALLSSAALIENVYAWSELDGATLNATFGNGSAVEATLDELSNFVDGGFSNTSVLLSMTTLGWRLASVPPTQVRVQNWMVAAQLVIVLGFLVWVRRKMRVKSFAADRGHVTASDFTVMVEGIKRASSPEFLQNNLREWFTNEFGGGHYEEDHKVRVVMAVECDDCVRLLVKRKKAFLAVKNAEATVRKGGEGGEGKLGEARKALDAVDVELRQAAAKARDGSGTAFVTFEYATERNKCIEYFRRSEWTQFLEFLGLRSKPAKLKDLTERFGDVPDGIPIKKVIEVTAAPEPEDVLWENLEVSRGRSMLNTTLSICVVFLLLAISAGIMTFLKRTINDMYDQFDFCLEEYSIHGEVRACRWPAFMEQGTTFITAVTMALSFASSLVLIILNSVIRNLVYFMVVYERKHTRTLKEKTVFFKMSFAYLVNSVLLYMLVYYDDAANWYKPGLVLNQALLLLCSDLAINSVAVRLTNGSGFWPLYRLFGRLTSVSQAQLQEYYRPPTLLLGEMYASVIRTYGLVMYYGPMQPLCYWLGAATMLANYACSKYAMMHFYRVPPRMSDELCEGLRQVMAIILVGHVVVTMYFYANSCVGGCESQVWTPLVLGAVLYAIFVLVPVKYVPCLARFHIQEQAACQCCDKEEVPMDPSGEGADAEGLHGEQSQGSAGDARYSVLLQRVADRYKDTAFVREGQGGGLGREESARSAAQDDHEALFVSYDVPVPESSSSDGPKLTDQAKFLRYDFTPEILRVPYSQPKPVRVTQSQLQYSRVYDGQGGSEMHVVGTAAGDGQDQSI